MTEASITNGLDAHDLRYLHEACPEQAPRAEALANACIVLREQENDAIKAIAVVLDRGVEREILAVSVEPASRGKGVGRGLLHLLARQHTSRDSRNRLVATLWPPTDGGAGLLISAGFEPSRALIRFRRRAEPFESQSKSPPLRWLELHREPPEKRGVLLEAAAAASPGDDAVLPMLQALGAAANGFVTAGFMGNDVKVVVAGHRAAARLHVALVYSMPAVRDHSFAEHALARVVANAYVDAKDVTIDTTLPVTRVARTLLRLGFRVSDSAPRFILGDRPKAASPDVFMV